MHLRTYHTKYSKAKFAQRIISTGSFNKIQYGISLLLGNSVFGCELKGLFFSRKHLPIILGLFTTKYNHIKI
jgi:hypothetical protein